MKCLKCFFCRFLYMATKLQLDNSSIEQKLISDSSTKSKLSFSENKVVFSGVNSGTACVLENIGTPTAGSHGVNKSYVDNAVQLGNTGLNWKEAVYVRTTANVGASYASNTITGAILRSKLVVVCLPVYSSTAVSTAFHCTALGSRLLI